MISFRSSKSRSLFCSFSEELLLSTSVPRSPFTCDWAAPEDCLFLAIFIWVRSGESYWISKVSYRCLAFPRRCWCCSGFIEQRCCCSSQLALLFYLFSLLSSPQLDSSAVACFPYLIDSYSCISFSSWRRSARGIQLSCRIQIHRK